MQDLLFSQAPLVRLFLTTHAHTHECGHGKCRCTRPGSSTCANIWSPCSDPSPCGPCHPCHCQSLPSVCQPLTGVCKPLHIVRQPIPSICQPIPSVRQSLTSVFQPHSHLCKPIAGPEGQGYPQEGGSVPSLRQPVSSVCQPIHILICLFPISKLTRMLLYFLSTKAHLNFQENLLTISRRHEQPYNRAICKYGLIS